MSAANHPFQQESSCIRQEIAQVAVEELADRFGTPLYVYDLQMVDARIEELRPFDVIRYAQKANGNWAILNRMREKKVYVDAVSAGEIVRALRAGFPAVGQPDPVVYTADLFTADALHLVWEHHLAVNCGSPGMLAQYAKGAQRRDITLRVNPGFGHGHHLKTNTGGPRSKHGIWHEELEAVLREAERLSLEVRGLHMHIGSGNDLQHLTAVCHAMQGMAARVGPGLQRISVGGGLPVPYRADEPRFEVGPFFEVWNHMRQRLSKQLGHPLELEVEPGRYLVAEAGYLIAEVCAVKQTPSAWFYILDAGFQTLVRPAMYGAYHSIKACPRGCAAQAPRVQEWVEAVIAGPLCESGDVFTQNASAEVQTRPMPRLRPRDLVVIETAGAYGMSMASNYNSYPLPAEVTIDQGQVQLVRRRQTYDELLVSDEGRNNPIGTCVSPL